jgi:hypothetical protein
MFFFPYQANPNLGPKQQSLNLLRLLRLPHCHLLRLLKLRYHQLLRRLLRLLHCRQLLLRLLQHCHHDDDGFYVQMHTADLASLSLWLAIELLSLLLFLK